MTDFYVIGLPRSRTQWLSFFLTDDNTVCQHEYYSSHKEVPELFVEGKRVGVCDTNPLTTPDYGDKPVLIVRRDPEDVKADLLRKFDKPAGVPNFEAFVSSFIDKYEEALEKIVPENSMTVQFNDLSNVETLKLICEFVGIECTEFRMVDLCFKHIDTINRDIETSLRDTAKHEGMSYEDYLSTFDLKPRVTCDRILDTITAKAIFDTCWDEVSADGVECYTPNVFGEYWIGLVADGMYVGVYRFHRLTNTTWEGHTHMIPEHRKAYSKACVKPIKEWMLENLDGMEKINVTIPALYQNVVKFTESIGFVHEGRDRLSFMKNGELHDQIKMGMTRAELEGSL